MNKILVTGGSGFIGSWVIDNLLAKHFQVLSLDRVYKEMPCEVIMGDVKDNELVLEAVAKCDGVIHLAGRLGTAETINNPIPLVEANILGSLNIFNAVKQYKIPAVYISLGNFWMNNSYSITKNTAERFALMYNKEFGTKIAVVRGLNAYGPRQKHKPIRKIIPTFIRFALQKKPIEVYGDGEQIMDMIYVEDIAEILVRALILEHNCYDKVMDAGTGRLTSVTQIANLVNDLTGNKKGIKRLPMRPGEPIHAMVVGDPKTLEPLNFYKFTRLEDGMIPTIKYYEKI